MALNILLETGKYSGKTVVFFSLEMSREQLAMRLISNESFVDNKKLVTGNQSDQDWSDNRPPPLRCSTRPRSSLTTTPASPWRT